MNNFEAAHDALHKIYDENRKNINIVIGASLGLFAAYRIGSNSYNYLSLKGLRDHKRDQCAENKKILERHLKSVEEPSKWNSINQLSSLELIEKLQSRELKAVDVVRAYQAKALLADKKLNAIVEPIMEAEEQAIAADREKNVIGPLHGLPISIKDTYGIKGYDCTIGMSRWINKPFKEDSVIVKVLKLQGAIPFIKTNSSQTMFSFEASNPIFGTTVSPFDKNRIPGGSSGGESSLLAEKGSILGFGSDLGGSVRIPANMTGVCSLKPGIGRLSKKGCNPMERKNLVVASSLGPMSRDVGGLVSAMKALLSEKMFELDPVNSTPLFFQSEVFDSKRSLTIGYYDDDGYIKAVPSHVRGVHVAKATLVKLGHKVVPWTPPRSAEAFEKYWWPLFLGDKGHGFLEELVHDKVDACIYVLYLILKTPFWLRSIICTLLNPFAPNFTLLLRAGMYYPETDMWFKAVREVETYREEYADSFRAAGLDAVICPGFAMPAVPHGVTCLHQISYTALYNTLNFPAGSLPVTKVSDADLDQLEKNYPSDNMYHSVTKEGSKGSKGFPVNIQVASLPFQEETCLRVMSELEKELNQ